MCPGLSLFGEDVGADIMVSRQSWRPVGKPETGHSGCFPGPSFTIGALFIKIKQTSSCCYCFGIFGSVVTIQPDLSDCFYFTNKLVLSRLKTIFPRSRHPPQN